MDIVGRILNLIAAKGITEQQFLSDMHLNRTMLSDWKSGKSKSYMKYISEISEYFCITTDYLLTGEPPEQKKEVLSIKDQHPELIFYDDSQEPQIPHLKPVGKPKDQNLTGTTPKYYTPPVSSSSAADDDMRKQNEIEMLELFRKLSTRDQIKEIARLELLQEK